MTIVTHVLATTLGVRVMKLTGSDAVMVVMLIAWSVPEGLPAGVPATYRFVPFRSAVRAADTRTAPCTAGALLKSTSMTLAALPPHSAPQLRMKARVSLLLKTPQKGRSAPATAMGVTVWVAVSTTKNPLVAGAGRTCGSSLKARSFVPLGLKASLRTVGMGSGTAEPLEVLMTSNTPALRTATYAVLPSGLSTTSSPRSGSAGCWTAGETGGSAANGAPVQTKPSPWASYASCLNVSSRHTASSNAASRPQASVRDRTKRTTRSGGLPERSPEASSLTIVAGGSPQPSRRSRRPRRCRRASIPDR